MEDLRLYFASNLINLRSTAGMTQLELAEKLNYSDKAVSKWERAESIPDVTVVKAIADIFGVTVDYLISPHDQWQPEPVGDSGRKKYNAKLIIAISSMGIFTLAVLLFVILWIIIKPIPLIFVAALPLFLLTLLILNSIWKAEMRNDVLTMLLVASVFLLLYVIFLPYNLWQLFLVLIPAEAITFLSFRFKGRKKQ
jgi:transcriptional regulator with XRE-family HTH domain